MKGSNWGETIPVETRWKTIQIQRRFPFKITNPPNQEDFFL